MKKTILAVVLAALIGSGGGVHAQSRLPPCPQTGYWHNCVGEKTFASNGNKYVGEFRDDKLHGQGTYTWHYGDKYVGEFRDDKRHGQGTLAYSDGTKYMGEWRGGNFFGRGTLYAADGSVLKSGVWGNGNLISSSPPVVAVVPNQAQELDRLRAEADAAKRKQAGAEESQRAQLTAPELERREARRQESAACLVNLQGHSTTKSLADKVPIDIARLTSLQLLGNQSKPTSKDKAALSFLVTEWERCIEIAAEWRTQNYPPEVEGLYESFRADLRSVFADLYSGKLTFGDAAKARVKLDLDYKLKLIAVTNELQAKRLSEEQQRQAVELQNRDAEAQRRYAEAQNQQQRDAELQRQRLAQQQMEQQQAELRLAQEQSQRQLQQQQKNAEFQQLMQLQQFLAPRGVSRLPPGAYRLEPPPINCRSVRSGNVVQTQCQ